MIVDSCYFVVGNVVYASLFFFFYFVGLRLFFLCFHGCSSLPWVWVFLLASSVGLHLWLMYKCGFIVVISYFLHLYRLQVLLYAVLWAIFCLQHISPGLSDFESLYWELRFNSNRPAFLFYFFFFLFCFNSPYSLYFAFDCMLRGLSFLAQSIWCYLCFL